MKEFYDFHRPCAEKIEAAVIHRFFCTFHRSCGQIEENKAHGKIEDIQRNGGAGRASGGPIFSLRERKDRFLGTGLPYNILLRAALQLELDLVVVAF